MRLTHMLSGCRPEPLGRYLQGLGVLRLVGEQADRDATGHWTDQGFVLKTRLTREELLSFFLDEYEPTPMVAPWNKGSGLRRGSKSKTAERLIEAAEASQGTRFTELRATIKVARRIVDGLSDDAEFSTSKEQIISQARSEMPDSALACIDAAVALTGDGPVYPHIFGTGFNLGRLDLTANLLAHLDEALGFDGHPDSRSKGWLEQAIFGTETVAGIEAATGQYDPGHAGGVNTSTFDDGPALVNPWAFILQLEGALLFASGVSRRLGTWHDSVAAMPFTVRPNAAGASHLSGEETIKGELWLPLWEVATSAAEVRRLFSEARLRWRGDAATAGIDAARAVATLGVDRGITAFSRTVIAERLGQSPLAVRSGRVVVRQRRPVRLTGTLDAWLASVRRAGAPPGALRKGLRTVDEALMAVSSTENSSPSGYATLLAAVADIEEVVRHNRQLRDRVKPVPPLDAAGWLRLLDDSTSEFAVAWSIASMSESAGDPRRHTANGSRFDTVWRPSVREYVRGINAERWPVWAEGPSVEVDLWRSVVGSLRDIHVAHATNPRSVEGFAGAVTVMEHTAWLSRSTIEAFTAGLLDERRIGQLVHLLVLLAPRRGAGGLGRVTDSGSLPVAVVPAWRLLAPIFHGDSLDGRSSVLLPDRGWPSALAKGAVEPVIRAALARLRSRVGPTKRIDPHTLACRVDPAHLTAALLLAPSPNTLNGFINSFTIQPEEEHT